MWLDSFRNDPKATLLKAKLSIMTSPTHAAAGIYPYFIDESDPWGATVYIGHSSYGGTAPPFSVFVVPVQQEAEYELAGVPTDGSVDVLITTQLTACAFVVDASNSRLKVAHIQPPKTGVKGVAEGSKLEQRLDRAGHSRVYGLNSYFGNTASVIGLLKSGHWTIYGQQFNGKHVSAVKILHRG
jgi:hypothetical protein